MFTFNGTHADTYGVKVVKADRSPLPAVSNTLLEVPARNGAYFVRNKLQARDIQIDIKVAGTSEDDLRSKARAIGAWLYTTAPQALIFDDEPDRQYLAVVDTATLAETLKVGEGQIKFKCPMPYAEALANTNVTLTSNGTKALTNSGTAEAYGTLTVNFTGATTNFTVTHVGTGKKVQITSPFANTDVLVIDFAKGYVTLNGTNAMPTVSLDSDFFALPAGANSLTCTTFAGTATLAYKNRWL